LILTTEGTENPQSREDNDLTNKIIGCAIKVHKTLGPGLLESAYQACLHYELVKSSLSVEKEKPLPLVYEEVKLDCGYRMDLVVENRIRLFVFSYISIDVVYRKQIIIFTNQRFHNVIFLFVQTVLDAL